MPPTTRTISRLRNASRSRGVIFIAALGITVVLSALILVFAQRMRVEAMTAANRAAYIKADATEMGAEKWVLAQVESGAGDVGTITSAPAEALQIGDGYFWVIRINPTTDQQWDFGITDESGKININTDPAHYTLLNTQLLTMSAMNEEVADSIIDWEDSDSTPGGNGAESSLYSSLAESYSAKDAAFETLEELLLVNGVTPELMYGIDHNRNGIIEPSEQSAGDSGSSFGGDLSNQIGIAPYLTAVPLTADTRTSLNRVGGNGPNVNQSAIETWLTNNAKITDTALRSSIARKWANAKRSSAGGFTSVANFQQSANFTVDEFKLFAEFLRPGNGNSTQPLINPATASRVTLRSVGFTDSDADRIIAARSGADLTNLQWLVAAVDLTTAARYIDQLSAKSNYFSADIVAVSADGRAMKRVRIVVDASGASSATGAAAAATTTGSTTAAARIIYRKELTDLGWPLPAEIRTSMKAGKGVLTGYGTTSTASGSGSHVTF